MDLTGAADNRMPHSLFVSYSGKVGCLFLSNSKVGSNSKFLPMSYSTELGVVVYPDFLSLGYEAHRLCQGDVRGEKTREDSPLLSYRLKSIRSLWHARDVKISGIPASRITTVFRRMKFVFICIYFLDQLRSTQKTLFFTLRTLLLSWNVLSTAVLAAFVQFLVRSVFIDHITVIPCWFCKGSKALLH